MKAAIEREKNKDGESGRTREGDVVCGEVKWEMCRKIERVEIGKKSSEEKVTMWMEDGMNKWWEKDKETSLRKRNIFAGGHSDENAVIIKERGQG